MMAEIFISHVEEDSATCSALASALSDQGFTCWSYERDSLPGLSYVDQILEAIREASVVVFIISAHALRSPQMDIEVVHAHESGKHLVPLLLGISHPDFRREKPNWAMMMGSTVTITLSAENLTEVAPRIGKALRKLGVVGEPAQPLSQRGMRESGSAAPDVTSSPARPPLERQEEEAEAPEGARAAERGARQPVEQRGRTETAASEAPAGGGQRSLEGTEQERHARGRPARADSTAADEVRRPSPAHEGRAAPAKAWRTAVVLGSVLALLVVLAIVSSRETSAPNAEKTPATTSSEAPPTPAIAQADMQAVAAYRRACDGGDAHGCTRLGAMYETGHGVEQEDPKRAVALFQKACDGGDATGCNYLGWMYDTGRGVEPDATQAVALYRRACDGGYALGCTNLGLTYEAGRGVEPDATQAVALYRKGCDGGYAPGCTALGAMYETGRGVEQEDPERAAALFQKACDGGDAKGCDYLGWMYEKGRGVEPDPVQAVALYRKACDAGNPRGCGNLGWMYQKGRGVEQNDKQAVALIRRACDDGDAPGCKHLGWLYETGHGVEQDAERAVAFYRKACDAGDAGGCSSLKKLQQGR